MPDKVPFASVRPVKSLNLLSQREMASLANAGEEVHQLFRLCALAVLNTGSDVDDARKLYLDYSDFDVKVVPESRGLKLELSNCPADAFVDGKMIEGIRSHLFCALRDIVFTHHKLVEQQRFDLASGEGITDTVFRILRNAGIVTSDLPPRLVVCWGGHSISRIEYEFCKDVGYQLGLRGFDIATGCGAGAMKGPMKGATIGQAKQAYKSARFVGISEPGIIAAESPNPMVNELVILPDIEKRLEAFLRLAHAVIVFPGGAGTAEELFYLLGVKMDPANRDVPMPVVLAAPESSAAYFEQIDAFLRSTLGDGVSKHYDIICGHTGWSSRSPSVTTGVWPFPRTCKNPFTPRMTIWRPYSSTANNPYTSWPQNCGARFPELLQAISKISVFGQWRRTGHTSCTVTRTSCKAWEICWQHSSTRVG